MSEKKRSKDAGKWFREMKSELKKVVWPTLPQVVKNTGIVIAMTVIVAVFIGVVDLGLKFGVNALLPEKQPTATIPMEQATTAPVEQAVTTVPAEQAVTEIPAEQVVTETPVEQAATETPVEQPVVETPAE